MRIPVQYVAKRPYRLNRGQLIALRWYLKEFDYKIINLHNLPTVTIINNSGYKFHLTIESIVSFYNKSNVAKG